jgi:sulfatase maturation enzyme AslB (radical SAM superfamily)
MEALFAEAERAGELAGETAARFSRQDVLEAMGECTEVLRILRSQSTPPPPRERSRPGFNLSLNADVACNLACKYCDPLGYREKTRGQVMSQETARQALDFFFEQGPEEKTGCVTSSIGGEPLVYRELLDFVASYTRELRDQGVRATQYLSTNGMLLTDGSIEYLRVNQIPFG